MQGVLSWVVSDIFVFIDGDIEVGVCLTARDAGSSCFFITWAK